MNYYGLADSIINYIMLTKIGKNLIIN